MEKYKNKYRIQSHRKPNWDYSADALYFITIVTQNRECNLGEIVHSEMKLTDFGKIVEQEWFKSFEIRNELVLHEFVLMPNHLHAIVEIDNKNVGIKLNGEMNLGLTVEAHGRVPLPTKNMTDPSNPFDISNSINTLPIKRNAPVRLPKSISSFIAGFKSAVNTKIDDFIDENQLSIPKYNRNNHFFQPNYHDHIIRNQNEYQNISNYIIYNPANWSHDKLQNTSKQY